MASKISCNSEKFVNSAKKFSSVFGNFIFLQKD